MSCGNILVASCDKQIVATKATKVYPALTNGQTTAREQTSIVPTGFSPSSHQVLKSECSTAATAADDEVQNFWNSGDGMGLRLGLLDVEESCQVVKGNRRRSSMLDTYHEYAQATAVPPLDEKAKMANENVRIERQGSFAMALDEVTGQCIDKYLSSPEGKSLKWRLTYENRHWSKVAHRQHKTMRVKRRVGALGEGFQEARPLKPPEVFAKYKARLKEKVFNIKAIKKRSPLSVVPATKALGTCSSQVGHADINKHEFIAMMLEVGSKEGIGSKINPINMNALFVAFDFDEKDLMRHAHWVSVIPLFFGIKNPSAFYKELFRELGCPDSLHMKGLSKFVLPFIQMLVPQEDVEVREELKVKLSNSVFFGANKGGGDTIDVEEFVEWNKTEHVADHALRCLNEILELDYHETAPLMLTLETPEEDAAIVVIQALLRGINVRKKLKDQHHPLIVPTCRSAKRQRAAAIEDEHPLPESDHPLPADRSDIKHKTFHHSATQALPKADSEAPGRQIKHSPTMAAGTIMGKTKSMKSPSAASGLDRSGTMADAIMGKMKSEPNFAGSQSLGKVKSPNAGMGAGGKFIVKMTHKAKKEHKQHGPNEEKFLAYKQGFEKRMETIDAIKRRSPMSRIPATRALKCCASQVGHADIDKHQFIALMLELAAREGLATKVNPNNMNALFVAFDFDDDGLLRHVHWVSVIPLFYGIKDFHMFYEELFNELKTSDTLELNSHALSKYLTPYVQMLVPPKEKVLRGQLKLQLSQTIFNSANSGGGDTLNVEEFVEWCSHNSITETAFKCLADILDVEWSPEQEAAAVYIQSIQRGKKTRLQIGDRKQAIKEAKMIPLLLDAAGGKREKTLVVPPLVCFDIDI